MDHLIYHHLQIKYKNNKKMQAHSNKSKQNTQRSLKAGQNVLEGRQHVFKNKLSTKADMQWNVGNN